MQTSSVIQGDSYTIGINFDTDYNIAQLQELKVYCFDLVFIPIVTDNPRLYRVQIASEITVAIPQGIYPLEVYMDDAQIGIKKVKATQILVKQPIALYNNESINIGYNLIINLHINSQITADVLLANILKGDKGETGLSGGVAVINQSLVGIIDGSNAIFTSMVPFNPDRVIVYLNGQRLYTINDYITIGTNTLIFNSSPLIGDKISIDIF